MRLFIVRHAIAVERAPGLRDEDRALTEKGRKRFAEVVRGLGRLGVEVDDLLFSPWRRASETAQLLAPLALRTRAEGALAAPPDERLLEAIRSAGPTVAVVGHEPWLSELAAWLVIGDRAHGPRLALKKGGVVELEGDPAPGAMTLLALVPPRIWRD